MTGKGRKRALAVALAALACCAVVGVSVWQWQASESAAGGEVPPAAELPEGVEAVNVKSPDDYVGPDGENAVSRDDFDTDEEYLDAVADSMAAEIEVPSEYAEEDGVEYRKGTITVSFERSAGEGYARGLVAEFGGLWVDGTFAVPSGLSFARATVYFPNADELGYAGLEGICEEMSSREGVRGAEVFTTNDFTTSSDPLSANQYYLDFAVNPWPGEGNASGGASLDASSDRILQLSTCTVPSVEGARFVVTCVLESEEVVGL